VINPETGEQIQ
nr:Chain PPP, VAL-ILE-ASN-PRO-GLU-THR-GLY-GLU-GLN-ILE-GLN [Homo sapiens]